MSAFAQSNIPADLHFQQHQQQTKHGSYQSLHDEKMSAFSLIFTYFHLRCLKTTIECVVIDLLILKCTETVSKVMKRWSSTDIYQDFAEFFNIVLFLI